VQTKLISATVLTSAVDNGLIAPKDIPAELTPQLAAASPKLEFKIKIKPNAMMILIFMIGMPG
jgi:hypothetical protein